MRCFEINTLACIHLLLFYSTDLWKCLFTICKCEVYVQFFERAVCVCVFVFVCVNGFTNHCV